MHRRDDGLRELRIRGPPRVAVELPVPLRRVLGPFLRVLVEVVSGAERPPGTAEHDDSNVVVLGRRVECSLEGVHRVAVQRVERRGTVEGQPADGAEVLDEQDGAVHARLTHRVRLVVVKVI